MERVKVFTTEWFDIWASRSHLGEAPYYSLSTLDYVSVVAVTDAQQLLLVSQFRPVINGCCLELPSGHVEKHETPEQAARRELLEETGYEAKVCEPLGGPMIPDVGRLENKLWGFWASGLRYVGGDMSSNEGITASMVPVGQINELIMEGRLTHALNLAILLRAVLSGRFLHGAGNNGMEV